MGDILLLYKNIKKFRQQLGLSQEELAKKVGYKDRTSIAKIETGKVDISQSKIIEFAEVLHTTPSLLMGWQEDPSTPKVFPLEETYTNREKNHIRKYRSLKEENKDIIDKITDMFYTIEQPLVKNTDIIEETAIKYNEDKKVCTKSIPLYPKLAAAGTGQYLFDDIPFETILVDAKKYKSASYAIGVNGDSMEPTFFDGDTLIVDRNTIPEIGKIGIFLINGKSFVKRLGENELISDNPSYSPIKASSGLCLGCVLGKIERK